MVRRRRKYYFENVYGIDQLNMRIFRSLRKKLERDYLVFLNSLFDQYKQGPVNELVAEMLQLTKDTLNLLDITIEGASLEKSHAQEIIDNVDQLVESRDILISQAAENKALTVKLGRVQKDVNISPEDLSATKAVASKGVAQAREQGKEGKLEYMKRVLPHTFGLGESMAAGLTQAAVGPFAGIAGKISGDVTSLMMEKVRQRKIRVGKETARGLTPKHYGYGGPIPSKTTAVPFTSEEVKRKRTEHQKTIATGSLKDFFNKEAYKAKWTRELIDIIKGTGKARANGFGGLSGKFKSLGASILPFLGKAGHLALLGGTVVAAIVAIKNTKKATEAFLDMELARSKARESAKDLVFGTERYMQSIEAHGGLEAVAKRKGTTTRALAMDIVNKQRQAKIDEHKMRPWYDKVLGSSFLGLGKKIFGLEEPKFGKYYEGVAEIETRLSPQNGGSLDTSALENQNNQMIDELRLIKEEVKKANKPIPSVGGGKPRDVNDSADTLTNQLNMGGGFYFAS